MARSFVWAALGGGVWVSLAAAACSDGGVVRDDPFGAGGEHGTLPGTGGKAAVTAGAPSDEEAGAANVPSIPSGPGVGEKCGKSASCREGLTCNAASQCEPAGETGEGDACVLSAECAEGQCVGRQCAPAGDAAEGEACLSDSECAAGLRCAIVGLSLRCEPEGKGDVGSECVSSRDCFGGLACLKSQCGVTPPGVSPLGQPWAGVECAEPVDTDVKAYFEVPGAPGADEGDFFRLPFPTDVRKNGDKLDLSNFPTPGAALLGVDPVQLYVDAISQNDSGWGTYPTVLFRFSGPFDFDTFPVESLELVDVTDPSKGRSLGWRRFFTDARTNYICDNFVAIQPPLGSPLEPGHTYAAYILSEAGGVTLSGRGDGKPVVASENMAAVLKAAAPADATLEAAHAAFAPLRQYLAAKSQPVANVLTASVFTVADVRAPMKELADTVFAAPVPNAHGWVKCGGATPSPCPEAEGDRACGDDADGYDEYHALLTLPVYQQGTAPYLTPEDGGNIDTGKPREEDVCLSLTVPEGAPPANGWPTVVFAHGTGGNFRSHVRDEVAGVLAAATPKFAVIGIDQVEHGTRVNGSTESPNDLFFNFLNPAATRGNPLQGAADQLSLARFAKSLNITATTSTGEPIQLDASKLFFFGHSQGSTEGSLMLPFGDDYKAAVFSGNGASLRDALRTKTQPQNIAAALPLVLQDPVMTDPDLGPGVTLHHPVLSLLQQWIEPADPLNFAALIAKPLSGHTGKHAFQTFGIDDSYSPPVTMATFAVAGDFVQVTPDATAEPAYDDDNVLPKPVAVGYKAAASAFTLGFRQYGAPNGSDGHFVVFDTQAANDDMVLFLTGAAGSTPPVIGR